MPGKFTPDSVIAAEQHNSIRALSASCFVQTHHAHHQNTVIVSLYPVLCLSDDERESLHCLGRCEP